MQDTHAERRTYARTPVEISAVLQDGTVEETCQVLDFGQGGVRVACDENVDISHLVNLEISGLGQFRGTVAWRDAKTMGVSFCPPETEKQVRDKASLVGIDPF